jgi:hypothetical protein
MKYNELGGGKSRRFETDEAAGTSIALRVSKNFFLLGLVEPPVKA